MTFPPGSAAAALEPLLYVDRPGTEDAAVRGVVVHVPVDGAHDALAAYADGSVRYLNHAGGATVVEDASHAEVRAAADTLLAAGAALVAQIGPWEGDLPVLPDDAARLLVLTPQGPHFGQGPLEVLAADPRGKPVVDAATALLQAVVALTTPQ